MKTVVITGANRGIGLALCNTYLALGWQVFGVCRQASAELHASGVNVIAGIDVTNPTAIMRLTQQLREVLGNTGIDLLINNAGILRNESLGNLDTATITEQFLVNALAPLQVTESLLDLLVPAAKVAFITSRMGSIADNSSGGYYG
jgi:NAD(P)-dependent dehydrogenase (short-subunit alcohol dehydrogenase family)